MKNYYEIIGVNVNADERTIKNAYLFKLRKYHPDIYSGDKDFAEQKTKELNMAYDTLKDAELRRAYDEQHGIKVNSSTKRQQYSERTNTNGTNFNRKTNGNNFAHSQAKPGSSFKNGGVKVNRNQNKSTNKEGFVSKIIKNIKNYFQKRKNNRLIKNKDNSIDKDRKNLNIATTIVLALFIICFAILLIF